MIARYCSMLAFSTGGFRLITCTMCHSRPARRSAASNSRLSGPVASAIGTCLIQGMIRVGAKIERAARAGKARSPRPLRRARETAQPRSHAPPRPPPPPPPPPPPGGGPPPLPPPPPPPPPPPSPPRLPRPPPRRRLPPLPPPPP